VASPPTEADIQEEEEEVQEELEHVENGIRYGNGAPTPVAHAQPRSTSPLLLPISIPFPALPPILQPAPPLTVQDRFLKLSSLPTCFKPLPSRLIPAFMATCDRLAAAYLELPSENNLLAFLALPKVGLCPALLEQRPRDRLAAYPEVEWPEPRGVGLVREKKKMVTKLVETGRLGSAARVLVGESKVAELTPDVIEVLKSKHPEGPEDPFGDTLGPSQGHSPTADDIKTALDSFKVDTSPGISGWTVPLLRHATKSPRVLDLLTSLTSSIGSNTAPGASMLCTGRLTPLFKSDDGIRPIVVGELIYRLAAKSLLRKAFKPDFLLPTQLGVGTPGGVEPVVRAVERALEGSLDQRYTHLTSLDFYNAFNTVDRRDIANGLRQFAPSLYRLDVGHMGQALTWCYLTEG